MYAAGSCARSRISWPVLQLIRGGIKSWTGEKLQQAPRGLDLQMTSFWNVSVHMCMKIIHFGRFCEVKVLAIQISSFLPSFLQCTKFASRIDVVSEKSLVCCRECNNLNMLSWWEWTYNRFNSLHDVPCSSRRSSPIRTQSRPLIAFNYTNPQTPRLTNTWSLHYQSICNFIEIIVARGN